MMFKFLFVSVILLLTIQPVQSQQLPTQLSQKDPSSYIVKWANGITQQDKNNYLEKLNSILLCEYTFNDKNYAWLEFQSFPFTVGGQTVIDINGGVTPAQSQPEIDNFHFDLLTELKKRSPAQFDDCYSNFDLAAPLGSKPVTIFNLDTGVTLPICDNSTNEYDFCGAANCAIDIIFSKEVCRDLNGHGTHGLGIQKNIINNCIKEYEGDDLIDIQNITVFDAKGVGKLGAILCALDKVINDSSPRKIVNCSFSFYKVWDHEKEDPMYDAFIELAKQNIFSVMAAGNAGLNLDLKLKSFPACYFSEQLNQHEQWAQSTISVGAADCHMKPAYYSNFSSTNVDISTLGKLLGPDNRDGLIHLTGTSQATFATSAIAAILMTHQEISDLSLTKCSLINGSIIDSKFANSNVSAGILSASNAYKELIERRSCNSFPKGKKRLPKEKIYEKNNIVNIFPNPVIDKLNFQLDVQEAGIYSISVISTNGSILQTTEKYLHLGSNMMSSDLDLGSGLYYLQLKGENLIKNSVFVKI